MAQKISQFYSSPVATAVKYAVLTDSDGNNSTVTPLVHARNQGIYKATAGGAGDLSFYLNYDGSESLKVADISVLSTEAVDVSVSIEFEINGSWYSGGDAYSYETDTNLIFAGALSQRFNTIPAYDVVAGTPMRIRCTVSGATTIYCQVLEA
jgi:hypothetical protein